MPLVLARDFSRNVPPWSFALTPTWSPEQLAFIALAGAVLGLTSGRAAVGLAGVALGTLLGLAADLWWIAGFVKPEDQAFVTLLPQAEWRSRLIGSALALLGVVCAGYVVGAGVRWLIRDRSGPPFRRPAGPELVAILVAVIGGPLLALGISSAAASSGLVVPDGAQVQTVSVSAGAITVDPAILRPGPTRFRCEVALDAAPAWASLIALPEGADIQTASPALDEKGTYCGIEPGDVMWGAIVDLRPGRYVWQQIDRQEQLPRTIATSPVFVVAP